MRREIKGDGLFAVILLSIGAALVIATVFGSFWDLL